MASRHFSVKHGKVGRGKKHALYIAGQGSYAERDDVVFMIDVNMPSWARDGADFFDAADKMERANGRTYTEFEFAIPRGITDPVAYAREFASKTLGKNHPYRLAVHDKLASDGGRNVHAHLMFTERKLDGVERDLEHFFLRANAKYPDRGGAGKDRKWNDKKIVEDIRQEYSNFAKSHGVELDLRSNLVQGLDEAEPKIGPVHDRSDQSKNRGNLISKVESLRDERLAKADINPVEQKQKYEFQQKVKERRKELWTSFHKQRRSSYSKLADEFKVSHVHQKEKLALIKSAYFNKREALKNDLSLKYIERRAAISIANMERITQELAIKAEFEFVRQAIKTEQNEHYFEKYRAYLESQAQLGDEVAQAELDRLIANKRKTPEEQNSIVAIGVINKLDPAQLNLKFEVNRGGEVTYKMYGLDVIKDVGKRVNLLQTDDLTIETALRLAQAKFGSKLTLTGSRDFQERVAMIAAQQGLTVEFVDPAINRIMQQHKQDLATQRDMQVIIERNLIAAGKKLQGIESIDHRAQASIRLNVAGLETTNVLQASFADAERIAKANGFDPLKPANRNYRGSVMAVTSHHAIQNIGMNKVVIHELAKIESKQTITVGTMLDVNYQTVNPIVKTVLGNENQKPRVR
jgi:co-chaperonin GroES (HSP10)